MVDEERKGAMMEDESSVEGKERNINHGNELGGSTKSVLRCYHISFAKD